jgi:exonuclease III
MKTNSKQRKDLRLATWNVRSLYRLGGLRITINELRKYKIAIAAIQETRWNKFTPQAFTSNGYNIYTSSLANNHGFGTAFLVDSKFNQMVINFTPINERLCVIRIIGRFFNYTLSSTYMHQQMTQKRRPRINFMSSWSGHTQPAQVMA